MDDLSSINDYSDLDAWVDEQMYKYTKVRKNTKSLKSIICPKGVIHDSLIDDKEFHDLAEKIEETIRNCQIVLRKIDIYDSMIESDEENFKTTKKHCEEINKLNRVYVKKWNKIAPVIRKAIQTIKKTEEEN